MPKGKAKPKAVETVYFSLETPEDFLELLKQAVDWGYSGTISAHTNPGDDRVWGIQLVHEFQDHFEAITGDVTLWETNKFRVIPTKEFKERYNT